MKIFSLFTCLFILASCQKEINELPVAPSNRISETVESSTLSVCNYDLDEAVLTSAGWTKAWEDDFSGGLEKWNVWTGGAYNNELQHYQGSNLELNAGILSIVAKRETVTGATLPSNPTPKTFEFTSGRIEGKTHFSASSRTPKVRMIARLKIATGVGMWPAFWSYGDPWPTQGEIDIMEARGTDSYNYSTAYWWGRKAGINTASNTEGTVNSSESLSDCWHVYEVIWEKNSLTYLFDGKVVITKTGGSIPNFYRKSQRVTLNLAVGGPFVGSPSAEQVVTGTFQIDWVKVFTSK